MASNSMDVDVDVPTFLAQAKQKAPLELKEHFTTFGQLYEKKLWHQLTVALEKFFALPAAAPFMIPLVENFMADWEKKMNQVKLVQFTTRAAKELKDPKKSLDFLSSRAAKLAEKADAKDAYVLASMETAHYRLVVGDYDGCKKTMDECEKVLDELQGVDPIMNASFYRVSADYYKTKAAYPQYYKSALLFLSSISADDLSAAEKVERAFDLSIAAVLGEGIYNFGELLMHPIFDSLVGTQYDWLRQLLLAFNSGDLDLFDKISRSGPFLQQALFVKSLPFLREKLCLMSLIECVFKRSKDERGCLRFEQVSKECRVSADEVEHLVMKALSLGLLKGKLDEIDKMIQVTWVQPRVLDKNQISVMKERLNEWADKVKERAIALENEEGAHEVFVQ